MMTGTTSDTELVTIYVDERHKAEWQDAKLHEGYTSLSKYLYELILEARGYRREGFLAHHDSEERIEELEEEVAALEEQLTRKRRQASGRKEVDDPDFIRRFLTDEYQTLAELMQEVIESGALDTIVRKRVESQLYFLASHGRVAYEPGHGWKLADEGEA